MSTEPADPTEFFSADHRRCDDLWAEVERAADSGEAANLRERWDAFEAATRRHLAMEEEVLFPAFEEATGMSSGPTQVMRMEHQRMRALLDQMGNAARVGALEELVDQGDTLLMLTQQHNQKEEMMLYPMASRALGGQWAALRGRLERFDES